MKKFLVALAFVPLFASAVTVSRTLTCPATFADVNWIQFRPAASGNAGQIDVRMHACLKGSGTQIAECHEFGVVNFAATGATTAAQIAGAVVPGWNTLYCL